ELALRQLHAESPIPCAPRRVKELETTFVSVVREYRARLPPFELAVLVLAHPQSEVDGVNRPRQSRPTGLDVIASLLELDSRERLFLTFLVRLMCRIPVVGFDIADRDTEEPPLG